MKLKILFLMFIIPHTMITNDQDRTLYEKTSIKGLISGSITKGYLFKTSGNSFYEIIERTRQRVRGKYPNATIYKNGNEYKLVIEGFEEPVICRKIKDVIEAKLTESLKVGTVQQFLNLKMDKSGSSRNIHTCSTTHIVLL